MLRFRVLIACLEFAVGLVLLFIHMEGMKVSITTANLKITNSIVTIAIVPMMFRLELVTFGKLGFSKPLDLLFTVTCLAIYSGGFSLFYEGYDNPLDVYKYSLCLILMAFFLLDFLMTWRSIASGEEEGRDYHRLCQIVVNKKRVNLMMIKRKKSHHPRLQSKYFFYKPWKRYKRYKDPQEERSRVKKFLQKSNIEMAKRGSKKKNQSLTPQQKLLLAIEEKEAKELEEMQQFARNRSFWADHKSAFKRSVTAVSTGKPAKRKSVFPSFFRRTPEDDISHKSSLKSHVTISNQNVSAYSIPQESQQPGPSKTESKIKPNKFSEEKNTKPIIRNDLKENARSRFKKEAEEKRRAEELKREEEEKRKQEEQNKT